MLYLELGGLLRSSICPTPSSRQVRQAFSSPWISLNPWKERRIKFCQAGIQFTLDIFESLKKRRNKFCKKILNRVHNIMLTCAFTYFNSWPLKHPFLCIFLALVEVSDHAGTIPIGKIKPKTSIKTYSSPPWFIEFLISLADARSSALFLQC